MKSLEELKAIRDRMKNQVELRDQGSSNIRVVVGMATCGIASGAVRCSMPWLPRYRNAA